MATVNFFLRKSKSKKKQGKGVIVLRFYDEGIGNFTDTLKEFELDSNHWDSLTGKVNKTNPKAEEINLELDHLRTQILKIRNKLFRSVPDRTSYPTSDEIKLAYLKEIRRKEIITKEQKEQAVIKKEQDKITLIELIYAYRNEKLRDKQMSDNTKKDYNTTANHIKRFQVKENRTITLDRLSKEFYRDIRDFFLLDKAEGGRGMSNSSVNKYLGNISTVIEYFSDRYNFMNTGYLEGNRLQEEDDDENTFFATYEELEQLKRIDFSQLVIDEFLDKFHAYPDNGLDYWTTKELAAILNVKSASVRKMVERYNLPNKKERLNNHVTLTFNKTELIQWMKDNRWCKYGDCTMGTLKYGNHFFELLQDIDFVVKLYIFASYAPARYGDLRDMKIWHMKDALDDQGNPIKILDFFSEKTQVHTSIPLNNWCLEFIRNHTELTSDQMLLPIRWNDSGRVNEILRHALRISGLFDDFVVERRMKGDQIIEEQKQRWEVLNFHTSRHNYGTNMIARGESVHNVKLALGHKLIKTTERYVHVIKSKFFSSTLSRQSNHTSQNKLAGKVFAINADLYKKSKDYSYIPLSISQTRKTQ